MRCQWVGNAKKWHSAVAQAERDSCTRIRAGCGCWGVYVGSLVTFTSKEQGPEAESIKAFSEQILRAEAEPCPQSHRDVLWEHEAISSAHPRQVALLARYRHLVVTASPPLLPFLYSISCTQEVDSSQCQIHFLSPFSYPKSMVLLLLGIQSSPQAFVPSLLSPTLHPG